MNRELCDKLIADYEAIIQWVERRKSVETIKSYLQEIGANFGICYYSETTFDISIRNDSWVMRCGGDCNFSDFWTITPNRCATKSEILTSLRTRVDILKTFE